MEVYHHSIRADYDISIEFTGSAQGKVDVKSNGNVIIDGAIKNASGDTTIESEKAIYYKTSEPIISRNITLKAKAGIGINLPVLIDLQGGALKASTTNGNIHVKEVAGPLTVEQAISNNGNVRLEAETNITATANANVQGNLIELIASHGAIYGAGGLGNYIKVKAVQDQGMV